jgi:hypothetical protein
MKSILDNCFDQFRFQIGTKIRWKNAHFTIYELVSQPKFGIMIANGGMESYSLKTDLLDVQSKTITKQWICPMEFIEIV